MLRTLQENAPIVPTRRPRLNLLPIGLYGTVLALITLSVPVMRFVFGSRAGFMWLVLLTPSLALGALAIYGAYCTRRKNDRRRKGQCTRCGYDLRGSTDRCPECGKLIGKRRSVMPP